MLKKTVVFLLLLFIFSFFLSPFSFAEHTTYSNSWKTCVGSATNCDNTGGEVTSCPNPPPTSLQAVQDSAKKNYGVIFTGSVITLEKAQVAHQTLCLLFQSQTYSSLIKTVNGTPITVFFEPRTSEGFGRTCGGNIKGSTVTLAWCVSKVFNQFMLIHEFSHILKNRNDSVWNQYRKIYDPRHPLPTFNCLSDYGTEKGPYEEECFADNIPEYVFNSVLASTVPAYFVASYETSYAAQYAFARDVIFGGTTYNINVKD